jgi:hypothetical protein
MRVLPAMMPPPRSGVTAGDRPPDGRVRRQVRRAREVSPLSAVLESRERQAGRNCPRRVVLSRVVRTSEAEASDATNAERVTD